jgi:hypothetical protein
MQIKLLKLSPIMAAMAVASLGLTYQAEAQMPRLKPIPPSLLAPRVPEAATHAAAAGSAWTPLTNQPTFLTDGAANPILLTDGSVLIQNAGLQDWWKLTPDQYGSYANGTWTEIASLPTGYAPLYHSSQVLPDGRLIIEGGEYNFLVPEWSPRGAIYDPVANTWTSTKAPAFFPNLQATQTRFGKTIGDAQSIVLADGRYMQADCCTTNEALLDAKNLTWTPTGAGKADINDEEGWTLLPSGKVLTVDAYVFSYDATGTNSEIYDPKTGTWTSAGSTIVQLWDSQAACGNANTATYEVGPAVLRTDGTVFYTGANTCPNGAGNTAIYNSRTGVWTAGPSFPVVNGVTDLNIADGPASWEPNDKVLMMASPAFGAPPSQFFEWDGKALTPIAGPPNAPTDGSYYGNMLVLPTGQILLTDFSDDVELYNPTITDEDKFHESLIAPVIYRAPDSLTAGDTYEISGIRFNGFTQGAAYGDDVQAATSYPLVRITNLKTSHVFYSRTHDHSSRAIATQAVVSTEFDVPAAQEPGPSMLQVVANGIASEPWSVVIK